MDQNAGGDRTPDDSELEEDGSHKDSVGFVDRSFEEYSDDENGSEPEAESDDGSVSIVDENQSDACPSSLCARCQYMFDNWPQGLLTGFVTFPHYTDYIELQNSAANGCALCLQFDRSRGIAYFRETGDEMQEYKSTTIGRVFIYPIRGDPCLKEGKPDAYKMIMYISSIPPRWDNNSLELRMMKNSHDGAGRSGQKLSWESYRGHANASADLVHSGRGEQKASNREEQETQTCNGLEIASRWLETCRKSHGQCKLPSEEFIPTRLICTEADQARLCLSEDLSNLPEYATLSHCWGDNAFHTLQRKNLESFKSRIPQEALSQTIIDSIKIARDLSILYIWIDSLCIIQDDDSDWMRESSLMSSVYGGSSLNIAASGAVDGRSGCFLQRSHTWNCLVEVKVGNQLERFQCVPQDMYYKSLTRGPLAKRGWALQERLLPARNLHFTPTQLVWECHKRTACESFPKKFPTSLIDDPEDFLKKRPVTYALWKFIVEHYAARDLTYSKDKMVAISGLARIIQDQTGDKYIAGMWRKNLEFQLCWESFGGQRVIGYQAPTWSWASVEKLSIEFPDLRFLEANRERSTIWIQISDIQLQYSGTDQLGQITTANICISCDCLLRVTMSAFSILLANKTIKVIDSWDCGWPKTPYHCFAMPVYEGPVQSRHMNAIVICGLLLQPTSKEHGQYRRLGSFKICFRSDRQFFKDAVNDPSCHAKNSDCAEILKDENGKTRYIINII